MQTDAARIDTATRVIAAPPEAVYAAIVDPAALVRWLPPQGMTGEILEFDARPGGKWRMRLTYDDKGAAQGKTSADADEVSGRFGALTPNREVVQSGDFVSDDPAFAGTMTMTWSIDPAPGGARVTIRAENVPSGISAADHVDGMNSTLANLAEFLE